MASIPMFDEGFFRLSRSEAVGLDPQCRVLLEQTGAALHEADLEMTHGIFPASVGVYIGCVWSEYPVLQAAHHIKPSVASLTGSGLNFMVGRVSYTFGLQGEGQEWRAHYLMDSTIAY